MGLGAAFYLQGLWILQTGMSLHVEAVIPEGCHGLLDVVSGVEGSTKCELKDLRLRALAILDQVVFFFYFLFFYFIFLIYGFV